MNTSELHAWSRHYDVLLWTVTGILTGGNAGLAVYALNAESIPWIVPSVGMIVTLLTVYFAASFRSARRFIHRQLPKDEQAIVRGSPTMKQWGPAVAFLLLVHVLWVTVLWTRFPTHRFLWSVLGIAVAALILWTAWVADRRPGVAAG